MTPTLSQSLARTVMPRQASTDCLSGQLPVLFRYNGAVILMQKIHRLTDN